MVDMGNNRKIADFALIHRKLLYVKSFNNYFFSTDYYNITKQVLSTIKSTTHCVLTTSSPQYYLKIFHRNLA